MAIFLNLLDGNTGHLEWLSTRGAYPSASYSHAENSHAEPIFINETATRHLPRCKNTVSCNNMIMNYCNNAIMYQLLVYNRNTVILLRHN